MDLFTTLCGGLDTFIGGDTVRLPPYYLRGTTYEIFQELGRTNLKNWEFCQDFGMLECWHAKP